MSFKSFVFFACTQMSRKKYSLIFGLILLIAFILPIVLSDEHSNKKLTDLPLKVAAILVNDEESNVSFIGSFEMTNDTKINNTELIKEIKFYYYSRKFPSGVPINLTDLNVYIDPVKPTKIITHGWIADGRKPSCMFIKDGFLYKYDANVLIMDWGVISGNPVYYIPMMATAKVGKHYGVYLNYLVENVGINPENIHLVGHSLGAHVSGFAARELKQGTIGRITGLDPALPGFVRGKISSETLKASDALFVDVIHTCAGYLGFKTPLGHADFYPDGGRPPQPGCKIMQFVEFCSHLRSWKIFVSSLISNRPLIAWQCTTLEDLWKNSKCDGNQTVMGDDTSTDVRGIFYSHIPEEMLVSASSTHKT